jgi:DNA-binding MarR family transcriptional regulator
VTDRANIQTAEPQLTDERLAHLIRLAARGFTRSLQLRLTAHDVTFGQWVFLRIMWEEDGLSQKELSRRANLTEPTTHSALQRLEKLELITRRNLSGNKRRLHAFLTDKGWALRKKLEPLAVEVNDVAVAGLDATQREVLRTALLGMIDNLEEDEAANNRRGLRVPPTRGSGDI